MKNGIIGVIGKSKKIIQILLFKILEGKGNLRICMKKCYNTPIKIKRINIFLL